MAANPYAVAAGRSHAIRLLRILFDAGLIPRGKFSLAYIRHDADCRALASGSALDCLCNPEVEVAGHCYLFSDFIEPESRP